MAAALPFGSPTFSLVKALRNGFIFLQEEESTSPILKRERRESSKGVPAVGGRHPVGAAWALVSSSSIILRILSWAKDSKPRSSLRFSCASCWFALRLVSSTESVLTLFYLLHGESVLHHQDFLHPLPGSSTSPHLCQGHRQGQEEKLGLNVQ